jgi:hypothetical protein
LHPFSRNVRRFSAAESFRSFMEGVRELHHYDKEADESQPDEDLLNCHLEKSEKYLRDCVETYPEDLLPRYYFGIVLSLKAQVEQARQLRSKLQNEAPAPSGASPDELFVQAARHFEIITQRVGGGKDGQDLRKFSQYNRAQALAKTAPIVPKPETPGPETPKDDR